MKKKPIFTLSFLKNRSGGILLPVMAILMMFTILLLVVTEDYLARQEFLITTKDFNLARTIEELSVNQVDIENKQTPQVFYYNIGEVEAKWNSQKKIFYFETRLNNNFRRKSDRADITKE